MQLSFWYCAPCTLHKAQAQLNKYRERRGEKELRLLRKEGISFVCGGQLIQKYVHLPEKSSINGISKLH